MTIIESENVIRSQNRDYTEGRLLGFFYHFGVTVICHKNADAMVLASATE
jgi:hypothetical protein